VERFTVHVAEKGFGGSISDIAPHIVEVGNDERITDVIDSAGSLPGSPFVPVTDSIARRVGSGEEASFQVRQNLQGIDRRGRLRFGSDVTVEEFLRAADAGLYDGDGRRLVVFQHGGYGGWEPDGLVAAAEWLLGAAGAAVVGHAALRGVTWLRGLRRAKIRRDWRRRGFTAPRLVALLSKNKQWDVNHLARLLNLEVAETRVLLKQAGYEEGADELWRLSSSPAAVTRRANLLEIEKSAAEDGP
jgi:hypothetical protein